jgi:hypothetical protein
MMGEERKRGEEFRFRDKAVTFRDSETRVVRKDVEEWSVK